MVNITKYKALLEINSIIKNMGMQFAPVDTIYSIQKL